MNKENIGSYLWIIITVTIMLCLMAFASPFGVYIRNNLEEFAGDYIEKEGEQNRPVTETFKLTIYYNTGDSGQSIAPVEAIYKKFEQYNIASPQINGYVPDKRIVQGQILEETTITVNYTRGNYSIQYVTNGGTWVTTLMNAENKLQTQYTTYAYGEGKQLLNTVDKTQLTKHGMVFIGWYDNELFNGDPISVIDTDEYGDKVFYARWGGDIYNINYVLNDKAGETYYVAKEYAAGSIAEWDSVVTDTNGELKQQYKTYEAGTQMKLPTTIHKFGYTFLGWSETPQTANQTTQYRTQITESDTGDKTFYAHWKRNVYTITYHLGFIRPNGEKVYYTITEDGYVIDKSTGQRVNGTEVEASKFPTKYTYGDTIQLPDSFKLEGYDDEGTMIGWYNQETERISITSGGETYGTVNGYPTDAIHKTKISPAILGFMKENTISHNYDHTNLDLYIKPIPNKYDIQYNSNMVGNVFTQPNIPNYKQGFIYEEVKELTKVKFDVLGRTFQNWNSQADGTGVKYDNEQLVNIVDDVIDKINPGRESLMNLYAQWRVHQYTVEYDLNRGPGTTIPEFAVGGSYPTLATYDQSFKVTNPTRYGYTFVGWKVISGLDSRVAKCGKTNIPTVSITGSTMSMYCDKEIYFVNLTPADNGKVILQAQWEKNGGPEPEPMPPSGDKPEKTTIIIQYNYNKPDDCTSTPKHDVAPSTAQYDTDIYISNPTMTGYKFMGWTISGMSPKTHYRSDVALVLSNNTVKTNNNKTPTSFDGTTLTTKTKSTHFMNLTNNGEVTFTAHWEPIEYKIVYNLNPGNGTTEPVNANGNPEKATYDKEFTVNYPTRLGYMFRGWKITGMDTVIHYFGEDTTTSKTIDLTTAKLFKNLTSVQDGTITFTAIWAPKGDKILTGGGIEIIYNYNKPANASNKVQHETKPNNAVYDADIFISNPTLTGWTFEGWTITGMSDKMTHYHGTSTITPNYGNVVMSNGNAPTGFTGTSLTNKTKSTHFMNLTDVGPVTFTAHWKANPYTVTYNGNGHTGGSTANSSHIYDTAKKLTKNGYTKTGYCFSGWNTKADGKGTAYSDEQSVINLTSTHGGTVTLYAQWTACPYTVTYNGNGHTGGSTANSSHVYDTAKKLTKNGYTKTGYYLKGWNTKADGKGTAYSDEQSVKNLISEHGGTVTLYAQWAPEQYTVTYNGNGATSGSMTASVATFDSDFRTSQNAFTRTGYTFTGWNEAANGSGVAWNKNTSGTYENGKYWKWTYTKNITLYAQWTPNKYTVVYDGNGNTSGSMKNSNHTYDEAKALTANGYAKTDHYFDSWNTQANGKGTSYTDKQSVINLTSKSNGEVKLYAIWKPVHAHAYVTVTRAAGCTSAGYTQKYCTNADGNCPKNGEKDTISTTAALTHLTDLKSSTGTCDEHHHFSTCASYSIGDDGHNVEHTSGEWNCIDSHQVCSEKLYESEGYAHIYCGRWTQFKDSDTYSRRSNGQNNLGDTSWYYCGYSGRKWCFLNSGYQIPKVMFDCNGHDVAKDVLKYKENKFSSSDYIHSCSGYECKPYTISFDAKGGSAASQINAYKNHSASLPSTSRTGYTFSGWYTSDGTRKYASSSWTGSVTLTAKWTCNGTHSGTTDSGRWTYVYYSETQHTIKKPCTKDNCTGNATSTVSHIATYGSNSYYSATQHRKSGTCTKCGKTAYSYGNHSITSGYTKTSTQHTSYEKCSTCNWNKSTGTATNHSWNSWSGYSSTGSSNHKRTRSCKTCGYVATETKSHWYLFSKKCAAGCGYTKP